MTQDFTDDWYAQANNADVAFQNAEKNDIALKSCFSGVAAPANPVAGMLWFDTANSVLKIRNGANNAWSSLLSIPGTGAAVAYNLLVTVSAGQGLTGGGVLTGSITIAIANKGITQAMLGDRVVGGAQMALGGVRAENVSDGMLPVWSDFSATDKQCSPQEEVKASGYFICPAAPVKLRLAAEAYASGTNLDIRLRVNGNIYSSYARKSSGVGYAWVQVADCDISVLTPLTVYKLEILGKNTGTGYTIIRDFIVALA